MSAPDVESQESTVPKTMEENTTMINDDDNAGKGMGIAIFVLLIIGTVSAFFLPYQLSMLYCRACACIRTNMRMLLCKELQLEATC